MQELLRSYYDMGDSPAQQDESLDIDASGFAPAQYVEGLLQSSTMEELLRADDKMVKEVKSLDSDMRELVYENYNKFIAATDTIRKMKGDVASMEEEMAQLEHTMEQVSASSASLNASLSSKRDDVDKLVGVRRLLQKLEFLFELPAKLAACIDSHQYAIAVADFTKVSGILRRYAHVSSFEAIRVESCVAMDGLCVTLLAAVRGASRVDGVAQGAAIDALSEQEQQEQQQPQSAPGSSDGTLSPAAFTEYIGLLHQLGQQDQPGGTTPAELQRLYLDYHAGRLQAALARATRLQQPGAADGARVTNKQEETGESGEEEGGDAAAADATGEGEGEGEGSAGREEPPHAGTLVGIVERTQAQFLLPFAACAARFAELFLEGSGGAVGEETAEEAAAAASDRLLAFAKGLLRSFFTTLRAVFSSSGVDEDGHGSGAEAGQVVVADHTDLVAALRLFVRCLTPAALPLSLPRPLLLKLRVSDRGAEVRHALGPRLQRVARGLARLCVLICC